MDLRARRASLDERATGLDAREALAAAAERRLSERVEELTALQTKLEAMENTRRERDEANWRGLVKTYESMRPRDAAVIFNDLDQPVLLQVLDRMKESKAAPILAAMQPERARLATTELAKWRSRSPGGTP
jgi:flagellar motility protein MotE (MotC chaperone)